MKTRKQKKYPHKRIPKELIANSQKLSLNNIHPLVFALHIVAFTGVFLKVLVVLEVIEHNAICGDAVEVLCAFALKEIDMVLGADNRDDRASDDKERKHRDDNGQDAPEE